jgi:hypothetical protein
LFHFKQSVGLPDPNKDDSVNAIMDEFKQMLKTKVRPVLAQVSGIDLTDSDDGVFISASLYEYTGEGISNCNFQSSDPWVDIREYFTAN